MRAFARRLEARSDLADVGAPACHRAPSHPLTTCPSSIEDKTQQFPLAALCAAGQCRFGQGHASLPFPIGRSLLRSGRPLLVASQPLPGRGPLILARRSGRGLLRLRPASRPPPPAGSPVSRPSRIHGLCALDDLLAPSPRPCPSTASRSATVCLGHVRSGSVPFLVEIQRRLFSRRPRCRSRES